MKRFNQIPFLIMLTLPALITVGCDQSMDEAFSDSAGAATMSEMAPGAAEAQNAPTSSGAPMEADAAMPPSEPVPSQPETEVPGNEGDKFEPVGTNPFVVTEHDPQSTFAVDVDTASYDIFRRDVGIYGWLPQEESIRLEEFVNYFEYGDVRPAHDATVPFRVSSELMPNPFGDTTFLRVGVHGKEAPPQGDKKPTNLTFLIDVSGSMSSAAKLPLVQAVLLETLEILAPTDTVAIVTYASGVAVRLEPTPISDKETIQEAINSLKAGGSTNGAGGIQLAYEQAEAAFLEGGINHVLLCSDGDFNVGVSSNQGLVDLITEKRKTGITLTVLGFGSGNLNDAMMEKVSNAGNGVYGVITDEDQAISYVNNRMLSTLTFIAKDVKIQVEFNADHVLAYRLLGYENRAIPDHLFHDDTVDAGEIGAGHTVTALYELVHIGASIPAADGAPDPETGQAFDGNLEVTAGEFARIKVRYKDVDATEEDEAHEVFKGLIDDMAAVDAEDVSEATRFAVAVAGFAEILKASPYADLDHLPAIQATLASLTDGDPDREELVGLVQTWFAMINPTTDDDLEGLELD